MFRWIIALTVLISIACGPTAQPASSAAAPAPTPAAIIVPADIASRGQLRVALFSTEVGLIAKNPSTGELSGVSVDIGRELARRFGVTFVPVDAANYQAISAAVKAGTADLALVAPLPEREIDFDFTSGVVETDLTYLVPAGSALKTSAEVDKPGVRIVVRRGTAVDGALSRVIKQAELVRVEGTLDDALSALRAGGGDVLAAARPNLIPVLPRVPGSVIMADRFAATQFALAVPKGKTELLRAARQFASELNASDFVKEAITRAGAQGVQAVTKRS